MSADHADRVDAPLEDILAGPAELAADLDAQSEAIADGGRGRMGLPPSVPG